MYIRTDGAYIAWITSKLFVDKTFSNRDRAFGEAMLVRIKHHHAQLLRGASWMSIENRELAIEKRIHLTPRQRTIADNSE